MRQGSQKGICSRLIVWLGLVCLAPFPVQSAEQEIYFSFLGEQFDNELLVPLGRGTVRLFSPRTDGLLISLPTGHKLSAVGVSPRFQLQGDFEITASYEVPSWNQPKAGYGMGPGIYLKLHDEKESAVSIGRLLRPRQKHVFNATLSTTVEGERKHDVKLSEAKQNSGTLKLTRKGSMLTFFVMEEDDGPFQELRQVELGTADVDLLRLGAQQSDDQTPVRVLWKDLRVKAASFPNHPDTLGRGAAQHVPRYQHAQQPETLSLYWSLFAGIGLLLVLGAVVWVRKRA